MTMPVQADGGLRDIYLIFENETTGGRLFHLDWMRFEK